MSSPVVHRAAYALYYLLIAVVGLALLFVAPALGVAFEVLAAVGHVYSLRAARRNKREARERRDATRQRLGLPAV
jgi:hypothetical protein